MLGEVEGVVGSVLSLVDGSGLEYEVGFDDGLGAADDDGSDEPPGLTGATFVVPVVVSDPDPDPEPEPEPEPEPVEPVVPPVVSSPVVVVVVPVGTPVPPLIVGVWPQV